MILKDAPRDTKETTKNFFFATVPTWQNGRLMEHKKTTKKWRVKSGIQPPTSAITRKKRKNSFPRGIGIRYCRTFQEFRRNQIKFLLASAPTWQYGTQNGTQKNHKKTTTNTLRLMVNLATCPYEAKQRKTTKNFAATEDIKHRTCQLKKAKKTQTFATSNGVEPGSQQKTTKNLRHSRTRTRDTATNTLFFFFFCTASTEYTTYLDLNPQH